MFNYTGTNYVQVLKWLALIIPAIGTLYSSIALVTGLPYSKEILGICSALEVFLMTLIGFASPENSSGEDL